MTTLALYFGRSDRAGRPLTPRAEDALTAGVADSLLASHTTILATGTLRGRDEEGTTEDSWHYLVSIPATASHLELFRRIAAIVRASGQRSYGVVGWSTSTVVPVDPTELEAWYLRV